MDATVSNSPDARVLTRRVVRALACGVLLSSTLCRGVYAQKSPTTEGLVLWFDADDTNTVSLDANHSVSRWSDKSGKGHHATQEDGASQPRYEPVGFGGKPALRFDGRQFLALGQPAALDFEVGDPMSIAVVYDNPPGKSGTFIARGGGPAGERAFQFYTTPSRIGAVTYGAMRECEARPGAQYAILVCDGTRTDIYVGGQHGLSYQAGKRAGGKPVDVLIGARRETGDNRGTYYPLTGSIAEILVYDRALSGEEREALESRLAGKCGSTAPTPPVGDFAIAESLLRQAEENRLSTKQAERAVALFKHADPFVRGMAEWAVSMKVGGENNGQSVAWPGKDPPDWFTAWWTLTPGFLLESDWVRQAVARGEHRSTSALLESVDVMVERLARMARVNPAASTDQLKAAQSQLALLIGSDPDNAVVQRQLWLEARRCLRKAVMEQPGLDFDRVVCISRFAPHTVRNITRSYAWKHKPGGDIRIVRNWKTRPRASGLLQGKLGPGYAWGLDLWWDADRVVFGYARQPTWPPAVDTAVSKVEGENVFALRKVHEPLHIFEVGIDGRDLRQLTDDPYWSDFEPTYCADGRIVFASDRCGRSAQCGNVTYDHTNPNLYILDPDRSDLRQLTDNKDIDRYPHSLGDGRIAYTHWEYQERHFMEVHAVWTVHPSGAMSDALFKHHMTAPCGLRDTRSIPGSSKLVAIATGHHTFAYGPVVILDSAGGLNCPAGMEIITPGVKPQEGPMAGVSAVGGGVRDRGGLYQTPWALDKDRFLVSYAYARPNCTAPGGADSNGFAIYLIDVFGNRELVHRDLLHSCSAPIPLRSRPRPPLLPAIDTPGPRATCYVPDVYEGLEGVPRGTIKSIRVAQHVGWPFDEERGAMDYIPGTAGQKHLDFKSWSPVRVIGDVPVQDDGSALFQVQADTAVYFQALDRQGMEVVRMRSMVSLKAGELRGCRGCHESQAAAPRVHSAPPAALLEAAALPVPPPWGAERLLGYEWLVQPILDRKCVRCHGNDEPDGGLDLSRTRGPDGLYQSFRSLFGFAAGKTKPTGPALVSCSDRFSNASVTRPLAFGSRKSPLIKTLLEDDLHKRESALDKKEWYALVTWIDANAPYHDAFINKRPADGGEPRREVRPSSPW